MEQMSGLSGLVIVNKEEGITSQGVVTAVKKALNVKTAVLVEKNISRPDGIGHADWAGFIMDDRYLIGCGMDSEEKYRHYPGIAVLR